MDFTGHRQSASTSPILMSMFDAGITVSYSGEVRHREASNPVAALRSRSATSNPSCPYGWKHCSVPSGRATAEVVPEPSLAQFTDAK